MDDLAGSLWPAYQNISNFKFIINLLHKTAGFVALFSIWQIENFAFSLSAGDHFCN